MKKSAFSTVMVFLARITCIIKLTDSWLFYHCTVSIYSIFKSLETYILYTLLLPVCTDHIIMSVNISGKLISHSCIYCTACVYQALSFPSKGLMQVDYAYMYTRIIIIVLYCCSYSVCHASSVLLVGTTLTPR